MLSFGVVAIFARKVDALVPELFQVEAILENGKRKVLFGSFKLRLLKFFSVAKNTVTDFLLWPNIFLMVVSEIIHLLWHTKCHSPVSQDVGYFGWKYCFVRFVTHENVLAGVTPYIPLVDIYMTKWKEILWFEINHVPKLVDNYVTPGAKARLVNAPAPGLPFRY